MPWLSLWLPKDTVIHRLNSRVKVVWALVLSLIPVLFYNPVPGFLVFLLTIPVMLIAKSLKSYLKRVSIITPVILVIFIFQSFFAKYAVHTAFVLDILGHRVPVLYEGLYKALWLISLLLSFTGWLSVLFMTTHPGDLFYALRTLGLPYTVSFIVLSSLQMIPMMDRAKNLVLDSQKSRGLEIGRNPLRLIPIMIPITVVALERIEKMTWSLEGRAFSSSAKRRSLRERELSLSDKILIAISLVVLAVAVIVRLTYGDLYIPYESFKALFG